MIFGVSKSVANLPYKALKGNQETKSRNKRLNHKSSSPSLAGDNTSVSGFGSRKKG